MANRNTVGFGLIAQGTVGSTPATQGQGKYLIDAGYNQDLFQGCTVKSKAGYIVEASSTRTFLSIGVFNGIFYNDATTKKPTFANFYNQPITPANSEDVTCFVIDNPLQLFSACMDAAAAQAEYGKTYSFAAAVPTGSEISGQCTNKLDYTNRHITNNQWRLLRTAEDPENNDIAAANTTVIVAHNLNQYLQNTGTAGITWQ
jgi:hypothetical protein|tara:strand:+ start:181 stop:786 length:606 start_codon:yes stop_codon:yes gene_type:complete